MRHSSVSRCAPALALLVVLVATGGFSAPSPAMTVVGDGLVLSCSHPQPLELRCDYRLTRAGSPLAARASVAGITLPAPSFAMRTGAPGRVAVLLLVDTSDPGRAPAIRRIQEHIAAMLDADSGNRRFGLASFDSDLQLLAPIGSPAETIKTTAATLQARGRTTELYRNVVEAIKLLATATDEHKVLVIFSDGLAEDRAYFHDDAVKAALDARITIHGIGYPRSASLAVGLQSLRRLADETGGRFVAASDAFELPANLFNGAFVAVENAGALAVNLTGAGDALSGGPHPVRVALETSAGPVEAAVPVTFPASNIAEPIVKVVEVEVPKLIEVEKVVQVPVPAPRRTAPASAPPPPGVPLWYWVAAIGVLALALLILLLVLLMQRRGVARPEGQRPQQAPRPLTGLAYLTLAEAPGEANPINSATFRIGRLGDNDLVLRDPSVSRHHAEIRRRRDGSFQILDLDSMNGVLVNSKKTRDGELRHGDVVEVGDVRMSFSVEQDDALPGEDTVMMKTVLPDDQPFPEAVGGRR